ncbi:hypothetical protein EON73_05665 [bacterium]|nr:MAG: hypothetical protein EON73_05665 [bacterium]
MGLFELFKKKQQTQVSTGENKIIDQTSLSNFKFYYLYGFTDNPNQISNDTNQFNELYKLVIGHVGGVIITNSYHPYFIVNPKGTTVWTAAYVKLFVNNKKDEVFESIINDNAVYIVDTSTVFKDINVWTDIRLTYDENPIFSKYVPFIIPFLVKDTGKQLNWNKEIDVNISTNKHASQYIEKVNRAINFFMPDPTFIIGFDEFDDENPSRLIDKIVSCKSMFEGK